MEKYIIISGHNIIGPYLSKASAEFRVRQLRAENRPARMKRLIGDKEFFPAPVGNRTNH